MSLQQFLGGDSSSVRLSIERLGIQSTIPEWIVVALLVQERSPQPTRQEGNFRLRRAADCHHPKSYLWRTISPSADKLLCRNLGRQCWYSIGFYQRCRKVFVMLKFLPGCLRHGVHDIRKVSLQFIKLSAKQLIRYF